MRTKIFFDTEFTEPSKNQNTTLVSIGLISECGKTFYAELTDYDESRVGFFTQEDVINKFSLKKPIGDEEAVVDYTSFRKDGCMTYCGNIENLAFALKDWITQLGEVELWGYRISYHLVLFNSIFGYDSNIPKNISRIPFDIATLFKIKLIDPFISLEKFAFMGEEKNESEKKDSLWKAKLIKMCYEKLESF
jgi:hypothetical protein